MEREGRLIRLDGQLAKIFDRKQGVYSYIAYNDELSDTLFGIFGRTGLCLKVFKKGGLTWGDNSLMDCTVIQNLFAFYDLAPRVYGIVWIDGLECWAQVTDYLAGEAGGDVDRERALYVQRKYNLKNCWDMNPKNFIAGKMVDFQAWRFNDEEAYANDLVEEAHRYTAWGSRSEPYQSVCGLIEGQRSMERFGMESVDFEGKTVLDIGCNLGMTCVEAWRRGASRVTGVDQGHVVLVAQEMCNLIGEWSIDFMPATLPGHKHVMAYPRDIVLLLSAQQTKPFPWVFDLVGETLLFEGHVPDHEETYRDLFEEHFSEVEFLGMSRDHGPRPVFRCVK